MAVVDIGTNSTRLLVTDGSRSLERRAEVTGLGRGVAASGRLEDSAIRGTCDVLAAYRRLAGRHDADVVEAVTTAAARSAGNTDEFLDAATRALGVTPRVISGEEEARLAFEGATSDLGGDGWTVVDVGGGSTEIVSGESWVSLDLGSVRTTEEFLVDDPPPPSQVAAALEDARRVLAGSRPAARVAGVAGTWTSLAAIEVGEDAYDPERVHHTVLSRERVRRLMERLAAMPVREREQLGGLEPARAPVIAGGAVVALAVSEALDCDIVVSERDLLDGLAARHMGP